MQDSADILEDKISGKRARSVIVASEGSNNELRCDKDGVPSGGPGTYKVVGDNGPVQQLVAMFGALVAQGEEVVAPLEILISSISADLLAEVVMTNMRNLPSNRPQAEGDEEPFLGEGSHLGMRGSNSEFENLTSLLTNILSESSTLPQKDIGIDSLPSAANELEVLLNPQPVLLFSFLFVSFNMYASLFYTGNWTVFRIYIWFFIFL